MLTNAQVDSMIDIYNASVTRMQRIPIQEWEEKVANAKDEKAKRRAEIALTRAESEESFELGKQDGISTTLYMLGYRMDTDDEDFCTGIHPFAE